MKKRRALCASFVVAGCCFSCLSALGAGPDGWDARTNPSFVNWETPHTFPLDKTPDGNLLLACNTADGRLEVFDISGAVPRLIAEVPVGVDPVSVRVRSNSEAWVVNRLSDSISIVDLTTMNVVRTLRTADEPCDVVFAGATRRAFVSCSQVNTIQVWDLANLSAAPAVIAIDGEDPRSLAVSPDGLTVYAAIFESGNKTTILGGGAAGATRLAFPPNVVSDPAGPYGGVNPPPNLGLLFAPAMTPGNPLPPPVGLIVKQNSAGAWMDDNAHDWTSVVSGPSAALSGRPVGWNLPDRDLAVINTTTLGVTYATGLMNICMSVSVNPATGAAYVIGTDAMNEVRFEPNVKSKFIRVSCARVDPATLSRTITDLNPHLTYASTSIPQDQRNRSLGDPRAIAWNAAGTRAYVAGMGSDNVVVIDQNGARAGLHDTIDVAEGPTGICVDDAHGRVYVLSKFAGTLSVIDMATETVTQSMSYYDPTPSAVKAGREYLYNTHNHSGLGQIACASCHVDARMDRLAWDLGDPSGTVDALTGRNLGFGIPGLSAATANPAFQPFHPMKGPMTTQTMQDIVGHEPHHWRGDRMGLEAFANAFVGLQGGDTPLSAADMQDFENFLASIYFPPNPSRNFDNSLPTSMPLPGHTRTGRFGSAGAPLPNGNAVNGQALYTGSFGRRLDNNVFTCASCHTLPTGAGPDGAFSGTTFVPTPVGPNGEHHLGLVSVDGSSNVSMKVPQLRNMKKKSGFNAALTSNNAGFGYLHDGSVDSLERFVSEPVFTLQSDQEVADLVAFIFCIPGGGLPATGAPPFAAPGPPSQETHAAVGQQTTLVSAANPEAGQLALIASMIAQANTNKVGLIVKGIYHGEHRGFMYAGANSFQSDRTSEVVTAAALQAAAAAGAELTYTVVFKGTEQRLGVDRDLNGVLDGDECAADFNHDLTIDFFDYLDFVGAFAADQAAADFNHDGVIDFFDYLDFVNAFSTGC